MTRPLPDFEKTCISLGPLPNQTLPRNITSPDGADMVLIPAGEFLMGSIYKDVDLVFEESRKYWSIRKVRLEDSERNQLLGELPQSRIYVPAFYIDRYEVTNEMYDRFVKATGYVAEGPWETYFTPGKERYPVVAVTWNDAMEYCKYVNKRLPTEAEWEKAARGTDGRMYPWGPRFDRNRCNNGNLDSQDLIGLMNVIAGNRGTLPIGAFPDGSSPYGIADMAGNVCEWTGDTYQPYPYTGTGEEGPCKVSRGGSWSTLDPAELRCAARPNLNRILSQNSTGFRCAASVPESQR
jgi:formylglycine-generating enzyme required for sulfatase activity